MPTRIGTAYFPTLAAAVAYYRPYGYTMSAVKCMIKEGSIHIGEPPTKPDERAYIVNEKPGRRYFIEILTPGGAK